MNNGMSVDQLQAESSKRAFLEMDKADAWRKAQTIAGYFETLLNGVGYGGPVAVAGGWVRDNAMGRCTVSKDLDIFLDRGAMLLSADLERYAAHLCDHLGHGLQPYRTVNSYGSWAKDLDKIVKIGNQDDSEQGRHYYLGNTLMPFEMDLIAVDREEMVRCGYFPSMHLSHGARASFLHAIIKRVDLRVNAIGSTLSGTDCSPHWTDDVMHERLVVQNERLHDHPEMEGLDPRIHRRLERLSAEKFQGWTHWVETDASDTAVIAALEAPVQGE